VITDEPLEQWKQWLDQIRIAPFTVSTMTELISHLVERPADLEFTGEELKKKSLHYSDEVQNKIHLLDDSDQIEVIWAPIVKIMRKP
jgi:DNA-binding transcriptional MerR regulator